MNNKKILCIIIAAFVLLMAGAGVLYDKLSEQVGTEQLGTLGTDGAGQNNDANTENAPQTGTPSEGSEDSSTVDNKEENKTDSNTEAEQSEEEQLPLAPDFAVYDIDGKVVRLSDFKGKPIVLNFWASWCGPCKSEMPDFDKAYAEYGEDIQFLIVNMTDGYQETVEKASGYIKEQGYAFPVYYDTTSNAAMTYGVYSIPTTYFINAEGYAVAYANTAINLEILEQGIGMIKE